MDNPPGDEINRNESPDKRSRSRSRSRGSSRERFRRRRSRSRSRNRRYQSRSRSISPYRGNRGFRGGARTRFGRRSPFRGGGGGSRNFRDRFRRSRSTSRGRFDRKDRRRFDDRRSRSGSPQSNRMDSNYQQQQQQAPSQMNYPNDSYNNYMTNAPQAPQFSTMGQFNSYDFQANNYPPQAPNFNMHIPAPPGLSDTWIPPQQNMHQMEETEEEKSKREAAIAEEKKRQQEGLKKQRDQYISRSEKMKRELKVLKQQKADLMDGLGKRSPSPKTNGFIKENDKLQSQISSKLSEILNVIDMLSGIIGKESDDDDEKAAKRAKKSESDDDSSPERIKSELLESLKKKKAKEAEEKKSSSLAEKVNYILYDPELHWCKPCASFPKTAKDYLNHLHSKEHLDKIANRSTEAAWRSSFQKTNEVPSYPNAPTKRAPIKGLQFFEPATAWFCKLCEVFMGDSWCVSLHLKSATHSERYNKLLEKEPKFEEKWLDARSKALELSGGSSSAVNVAALQPSLDSNDKSQVADTKKSADKKSKKKKNKKDSKKKRKHGKKRKRGSSSSSSDSEENSESSSESESSSKKNDSDQVDAKNSIRIAMRNLLKPTENDERSSKWTMVSSMDKPQIPPAPTISQNAAKEIKKDEQIIGQWNTVEPIISHEEKRLLESLKGKLKNQQKQEVIDQEKLLSTKKDEKDRKTRSRSRERVRSDRNYRGRRSRSKSRTSPRRRSRSRSRSRGRYGRGRPRYSRSRSRSPSKNSRSRYDRQPVVFHAEPRLPPLKDEKKLPARSYTTTVKKDEFSSSNAAKKMPFIGKMPVFKKQLVEKKNEDQQDEKKEDEQLSKSSSNDERRDEKWDELMPDPLQFSAIMGSSMQLTQHQMMNEQPDAPPGLDPELDSDSIPKPISDAPMMRKGPLPKDFQETLDLLFDGDKPKPIVIEPTVPEIIHSDPLPSINNNNDGPQMIMPEELSQHSILYGNFYQQNNSDIIQPVPPPPPISFNKTADDDEGDKGEDKNDSTEMTEENDDDKFNKNQEDMDDLAMLGIDVNDVGSGLW